MRKFINNNYDNNINNDNDNNNDNGNGNDNDDNDNDNNSSLIFIATRGDFLQRDKTISKQEYNIKQMKLGI